MNRLYALYRKLGKVSRRLKQTVTHPETWSRTLSGPAGRLRLLKTPPGPTETQVPGADQYSSIGINQYRQRRDNYQGRISTAIDKRNTETSIGGNTPQTDPHYHSQTSKSDVGSVYVPSCIRDFVS